MFLVSITLTNLVVYLFTTPITCSPLPSNALEDCSSLVEPDVGECIEQALHMANLPPSKLAKTGKETLYSVVFGKKDPNGGCLGLFHYSYCLFETACNRCKTAQGLTEKVANVKKEQSLTALQCQNHNVQISGQYNLSLIDCDSKYPSSIEMMTIMGRPKIHERLMDAQEQTESTTVKTTTENNDLFIIIIAIVIFVVLIIILILLYCFCCKSDDCPEEEPKKDEEPNSPPKKRKQRSERERALEASSLTKAKAPAKQSSDSSKTIPPPPASEEAKLIPRAASGVETPASSTSTAPSTVAADSAPAAPAEPAPVPAELPVDTPTVETALTNFAESPQVPETSIAPVVSSSNEAPLSVDSSDSSKTAAPVESSVVDKLDSNNKSDMPSAVEDSKSELPAQAGATGEPSDQAMKTDSYKVSPTSSVEKSSSNKQIEPPSKLVEKSNSVKTKEEEKMDISKSSNTSDTAPKVNTSGGNEKETFVSAIDSTGKWPTTAFPSEQVAKSKTVEKSNSDKIRNNPSDLVPQSAIQSLKTDMVKDVKLEEKAPSAPSSTAVKVSDVAKSGKTADEVPLNSASGKVAQPKTSAAPPVPKEPMKKVDSSLSVEGQAPIPLEKVESGTSLSSTGSSITSAPSSQLQ